MWGFQRGPCASHGVQDPPPLAFAAEEGPQTERAPDHSQPLGHCAPSLGSRTQNPGPHWVTMCGHTRTCLSPVVQGWGQPPGSWVTHPALTEGEAKRLEGACLLPTASCSPGSWGLGCLVAGQLRETVGLPTAQSAGPWVPCPQHRRGSAPLGSRGHQCSGGSPRFP